MADSTFTFRVDGDLKASFAEVAASQERTAAQLLRVLMREAVERRQESRAHAAWFRGEVERAIEEADDPHVERIAHDEIRSSWQQQRAALEQRAAGRPA